MTQFTSVLTKESFVALTDKRGLLPMTAADIRSDHPGVSESTLELARTLMLQVPEFSWTIEVDLLGRHRVTVHFKGAEIGIDAMELGR